MQLQSPMAGISFETDMIVKYDLLDTSTGKILFTRNIPSSGSVEMSHSWLGATRMTEARNRAVRSNIEGFISSLGEARF